MLSRVGHEIVFIVSGPATSRRSFDIGATSSLLAEKKFMVQTNYSTDASILTQNDLQSGGRRITKVCLTC